MGGEEPAIISKQVSDLEVILKILLAVAPFLQVSPERMRSLGPAVLAKLVSL